MSIVNNSSSSSCSNTASDQRQTVCRLSLGQVLGTVLMCSLSAFGCGLCLGYMRVKNAKNAIHVKTFEAKTVTQSVDDINGSWSCSSLCWASYLTSTAAVVAAATVPRLLDNSSFISHTYSIGTSKTTSTTAWGVPVGLSLVFAPTDYIGAMDLQPVLVLPHDNDTVAAGWTTLELQRLQSQALRPLTTRVDSKRRRKMERGRGRYSSSLPSRYYDSTTANAATTTSTEALVHPALLTHAHPRRILIVLSMATRPLFQVEQLVRHVLLHKTVEHVHIAVMTSTVLSLHVHVPLHVCGTNQTSGSVEHLSPLCDARVVIRHVDFDSVEQVGNLYEFFSERAHALADDDAGGNALYDVFLWPNILTRSNHTGSNVVELDRQGTSLLRTSCFRTLSDNGILVQQVPISMPTRNFDRLFDTIDALEDEGYASIVDYSESTYHYILAMKDSDSRERWFRNEAELNLDFAQRLAARENNNDDRAMLPLMDGATLMQYQFTSRLVEDEWCTHVSRQNSQSNDHNGDTVNWCGNGQHGHDPDRINVPITSFDVHPSKAANLAGRGVYTTQFVAQGSALAMDECAQYIFISSRTRRTMDDALDYFENDDFVATYWDVVLSGFIEGYGYTCSDYGPMASGVESGIMTFVNHGCNGTYNTGMATNETELSIALGRGPQGILTYDALIRPYHARMARHFPSTPEDGVNFALVDLQPGTEVLDNYLVFGGIESIDYWDDNLRELQTVCSGGSGLISNYETATAQQ